VAGELRVENFLAEAAAPHHAAIAEAIARDARIAVGRLRQRRLGELDEVVAAPGPALLFLCGLPYTRLRDAGTPLELLAAPVPVGPRYAGHPVYFSDLVIRPGCEAGGPAELDGALVAINEEESLSGFVLPLAELEKAGLQAVFRRRVRSGSHRRSLRLLLAGRADVAAVDSTVLHLEGKLQPPVADLRVVHSFGPAPSPPVLLVHGTPALRDELTAGLLALEATPSGQHILREAGYGAYASVTDVDYRSVRELDARVSALLER
jgi:phosphonate transport system substrate-binding protein